VHLFQSAPGLEAGRSRAHWARGAATGRFNPRPALRPGEACAGGCDQEACDWFQSAPGLEAGRSIGMVVYELVRRHVSIRARP